MPRVIVDNERGKLLQESREQYDAREGLNPSLAVCARKSMKSYAWHRDNPSDGTSDAMNLGTLSHKALLEPHANIFDEISHLLDPEKRGLAVYEGQNGKKPVRRGKAWEEFQEAHSDKTIVLQSEVEKVEAMAAQAVATSEAVRANAECARLLDGCDTEVTITAERNGKYKNRVDAIKPGVVVDLKTTRSAEPRQFGRQCAALQYHARLGAYKNWADYVTGIPHEVWIIAVENHSELDVVPYRIDEAILDQGWVEISKCYQAIRWHEERGVFPGLAENVIDGELVAKDVPFEWPEYMMEEEVIW